MSVSANGTSSPELAGSTSSRGPVSQSKLTTGNPKVCASTNTSGNPSHREERANTLDKARKDVKEHNDKIRAKQEADAQILNNSPEKVGTEGQSESDATEWYSSKITEMPSTLTETATQGPTITPTVELLENADLQTVTAVVESTEVGIPQGGLENAGDALLDLGNDGEAVTPDDIFDALGPDEESDLEAYGPFLQS